MNLIIGAGTIGRTIAYLAAARNIPVRMGVRDLHKTRKQNPGVSAEFIVFDFNRPDTWRSSLDGIQHVFFIAPHPEPAESVQDFLALAAELGVAKVVFSSGRTTGDIPGKPLFQVDQLVRNQSIPYVILRPGWFMQNFTSWIGATISQEGAFYLPAGDAKTAFIDVRDIAEVALSTLLKDQWNGHILDLTSEEILDHYQVADQMSGVLGRQITYVPLSNDEYQTKMTSLGWSMEASQYVIKLYEIVKTGKEEQISSHVREVLSRPPYDFATFLRHHPNQVKKLL